MSELPPLISPRSPSYERAREELKHPSPAGDPVVVALLGRLVEVEHNARQTCLAAAAAVADSDLAHTIRESCERHKERLDALASLITELGGAAPEPDESRRLLSNDASAIEHAGSDEQILDILRAMRHEVADAYAQAAADQSLDRTRRDALAALA